MYHITPLFTIPVKQFRIQISLKRILIITCNLSKGLLLKKLHTPIRAFCITSIKDNPKSIPTLVSNLSNLSSSLRRCFLYDIGFFCVPQCGSLCCSNDKDNHVTEFCSWKKYMEFHDKLKKRGWIQPIAEIISPKNLEIFYL